MKDVPFSEKKTGTLVGCVASHLEHPFGRGMFGQTGETDAARFQMNEAQHVVGGETSPGKHFDGEEVGARQDSHMGGNEILPCGRLAPLGCGRDSISVKDVSHRLIGYGMAEIGQRSDNAVVPPTGVLSGEADNERLHFGSDGGPPWQDTMFGAVKLAGNEPTQARIVSGFAMQATCW